MESTQRISEFRISQGAEERTFVWPDGSGPELRDGVIILRDHPVDSQLLAAVRRPGFNNATPENQ